MRRDVKNLSGNMRRFASDLRRERIKYVTVKVYTCLFGNIANTACQFTMITSGLFRFSAHCLLVQHSFVHITVDLSGLKYNIRNILPRLIKGAAHILYKFGLCTA
jgi:hypothetical protein